MASFLERAGILTRRLMLNKIIHDNVELNCPENDPQKLTVTQIVNKIIHDNIMALLMGESWRDGITHGLDPIIGAGDLSRFMGIYETNTIDGNY